MYVREDIPSNLFPTGKKDHIENFYVALNLVNEKWLMNFSNKQIKLFRNHLNAFSTYPDLYSTTHEKVLILGDFNVGIEQKHIKLSTITALLQELLNSPHVTQIQTILHILISFYLTHLQSVTKYLRLTLVFM